MLGTSLVGVVNELVECGPGVAVAQVADATDERLAVGEPEVELLLLHALDVLALGREIVTSGRGDGHRSLGASHWDALRQTAMK